MDEKQIAKAVRKFYENNRISPQEYTDDQMKAYTENKTYDPKITAEALEKRVVCWIDCFLEEDRKYFLKLMEKYIYISERELKQRFFMLCSFIFEKLAARGIEKHVVLFVTVPSDRGTGSGGDSIRNALLVVNMGWGIHKEQIVSDAGRMKASALEGKKAVIFMDDILGTGFSLRKTIDGFFSRFPQCMSAPCLWGAAGILASKNAVKYIIRKAGSRGISLEAFILPDGYVKSCMKGNYIFSEGEVHEIGQIIQRYEEALGSDEETGESYAMGYRACKLLLSFYYNTPNNTLCTFWKAAEENVPVFPRDKYVRPTIDMLKMSAQHHKNNAYLKGLMDRDENV